MCIEFARNVLGLTEANSTEFNPKTPDPVISLMPDQQGIEDMGGTMRLGLWACACCRMAAWRPLRTRRLRLCAYATAIAGSSTTAIGRQPTRPGFISAAFRPTACWRRSPSCTWLNPWMLGTQFHPEFRSWPNRPHPLFRAFLEAVSERVDK